MSAGAGSVSRRRVTGVAVVLAAISVATAAPLVEARDWQTIIVYPLGEPSATDTVQTYQPGAATGVAQPAPPAPMPATRPVVLPPGARSIPPWPRPLAEDGRELQLLNGGAVVPRGRATSPIVTGTTPEPAAKQATGGQAASTRRRGEPPPDDATAGQQYCFNVADAAADARFAWQQQTIAEIERELEKRVAMLEEKTREYKTWLARREEFANKAQEGLLKIYTRMRPDAAAAQIAAMDEETGAALMTKLDPRAASAIMAEMDPQMAARLSATIAGAARTGDTREQAAANARALQSEPKKQ
jgi:flagellar motility protein MotE (MotC chaperone)